MKVSEAFSGNFLKAADLPQPRVFTISTVTPETMQDKTVKQAVRFQGETRGFILNQTNALEIAGMYGDDSDGWTGQPVELFTATTFFQGRQVPCIRVRRPQQQMQPVPQPSQYAQAVQQLVPPQPYRPQQQLPVPNQPQSISQPVPQAHDQQPPVQAPADDTPLDA